MGVLTQFVEEEAERLRAVRPEQEAKIAEWQGAVRRLLDQLRGWVREADPGGVIEIVEGEQRLIEGGLGEYTAPRLGFRLEAVREAWVVPKARNDITSLAPPSGGPPRRSAGLVVVAEGGWGAEIGPTKYYLHRLADGGTDHWYVAAPGAPAVGGPRAADPGPVRGHSRPGPPMNPLGAAWDWYRETRRRVELFQRLVGRYWTDFPWDGRLGADDAFRDLDREDLVRGAAERTEYLNDLAVVVLFSAFEDVVRAAALEAYDETLAVVADPVVLAVMADGRDRLAEGSFYRVLQAHKLGVDADLVEQVNQVRKYRNWVAHGRRATETPDHVTPDVAYRRLRTFLDALGLG